MTLKKDVSCLFMFDVSLLEWHGQCCQHLSVSGVFEIRHLQISGYKADMVRSMQWRISDSFDVVCSEFSLSIFVVFDDFKGCWSCAAQSWRRVSGRNYWNWQRTTWHAKVPRFQFKRLIICLRGWQPILLTESGMCNYAFPVWDIIIPQNQIIVTSGIVKSEAGTFSWTL